MKKEVEAVKETRKGLRIPGYRSKEMYYETHARNTIMRIKWDGKVKSGLSTSKY